MDVSLLSTAVIATLVPWLTKVGDAAAQKAGEAVWEFLVSKAKNSTKEKQFSSLLPLLKTHPDSSELHATLKKILAEDLQQDSSFTKDLSHFMQNHIYYDQRIWQTYTNNQYSANNQFFAGQDQNFIDHLTFNRNEISEERCPSCHSPQTMKLSVLRAQVKEDRKFQESKMRKKLEAAKQELSRRIRMSQVVVPSTHVNEGRYVRLEQKTHSYPRTIPKTLSSLSQRDVDLPPLSPPIHSNSSPDFIGSSGPRLNPSSVNRVNIPPAQPLNFPTASHPHEISIPRRETPIAKPISTSVDQLIPTVKSELTELTPEERRRKEFEDKILAQIPPRLKVAEDFGYYPKNFLTITSVGLFIIGLGTFWAISDISENFIVTIFFLILSFLITLSWIKICRFWYTYDCKEKYKCQEKANQYNTRTYPIEKAKWDNSCVCERCGEIFEVKL